jgi:U3 small nucleolar RNA-associated protein 15
MFSANKAEITKNFTKFKDNVTALCSRNDAKLFAVGFESGLINVVDVKNKLTLRTFDNHKKRVNALEYCNFNDLFSGSDDMIVRQFDVVSGSIVHSYANTHTDYVKSIKCLQSNHILTASYDGKIKLFDFRVHKQAEMVFDHKSPVEAIDKFTNGLSFVACGGTAVSVWDVRNGKQLHYGANNKKTVTSIKVLESGERFLTGSLDQHLKIYSTDLFELTYNEKYSDSIMSIEVTPSQRILAVGLNNGQLHIKGSGSK